MWIFSMVLGLFISILFGLLFGSFGSVILSRRAKSQSLEQSLSIIFGRSECPNCKTTLQAIDLIPVFSFLFQGGRCRYCKKKISWFYPILELGTAIIFGFTWRYLNEQGTAITLFWMMTGWILRLMVVHSVLWYEIHMPLLFVGGAALIIAIRNGLFQRDVLWGGAALLLVFLVLYFMAKGVVRIRYHVKEDGLGIGDILMSPYLGSLLFAGLGAGFGTLDRILAILYFLIFSGIVGIIRYYLQTKQQTKRAYRFLNAKIANQSLPLLPSMVISMFIIILFKETLFSLMVF